VSAAAGAAAAAAAADRGLAPFCYREALNASITLTVVYRFTWSLSSSPLVYTWCVCGEGLLQLLSCTTGVT
jgi:hypothetical protein